MAKPEKTDKTEKSAPAAETPAPPKKSKLLLIIIAVLTLGVAIGAGWYFMGAKSTQHDAKETKTTEAAEPKKATEPKYVVLEPFTVNLQRETGDQFLQIGITLKIDEPDLEEMIKTHLPEIRSHLLMLLSNKFPSELAVANGKKKLAEEIVSEIKAVLGLRTKPANTAPAASSGSKTASGTASSGGEPASGAASSGSEAASGTEAAENSGDGEKRDAYIEVLFTSFIIQ